MEAGALVDVEAFGILAEEVGGGRRGDRSNPEDVVRQGAGDQQVDVAQQQVGDRQEDALPLPVAAQVGERQEQGATLGEAGQEGAEGTGDTATKTTLGGTTGGGGGGRPSLGWAFTCSRVPAIRPPSLFGVPAITIGAVFIMRRRVPVTSSSRPRPALSFMPFPPRQPWSMWGQSLTTIMVEHTMCCRRSRLKNRRRKLPAEQRPALQVRARQRRRLLKKRPL